VSIIEALKVHILSLLNGHLGSLFVDKPELYYRGSRSPKAYEHCSGVLLGKREPVKVKGMFRRVSNWQSTMPNMAYL
jgi:hypothetical protein